MIAKIATNGANWRVVANATRRQDNGSPDYATNPGRIAFFRVTYHKSGQGIAKSDLFVRKNGHNINITAHSSASTSGSTTSRCPACTDRLLTRAIKN